LTVVCGNKKQSQEVGDIATKFDIILIQHKSVYALNVEMNMLTSLS